ncbi:gamma-glutamyltransferase family protein [Paraburkholderia azotifigens]|uniref:gamma-glutamyltransferase family protein n=1 Tax=Paraburkholderia azotifigens TaxID=2057004 RepID=UPI003174FAAF
MRDFELPGRSLAMSRNGMAATSHPASTLAAIDVLRSGGNAMDAAIAACAVQCVVEPGSTGIGGDCFALYAPRGAAASIVAFDGAGWTPQAMTIGALRSRGVTSLERQSPHVVTVPGAVDAWCRLAADHGTMPLADLLAPAATLAEEGYAVTPRVAADWAQTEALLATHRGSFDTMLIDGKSPRAGSVHRQPALAATLREIGARGKDAFYRGDIASSMVECLRELGGLHTLDDFAQFSGEYVKPISTEFRGYRVHECPASGQGVIALLILNILRGFDADRDPLSADRLHREIEATRLAYSVRDAVLCDPRSGDVPVEAMLSEAFARSLRNQIDLTTRIDALPGYVPARHDDTVYICVVDKDRNCVSFINSIFNAFGSTIMDPRTGVMFHNRGQSFTLDEGHPNCIGARRRPMHTIIPGIVSRDDKVQMTFGVMGGHYQAMGHAHFLSKVLDYGLDMQAAISLPRVFPRPGADEVEAEHTLAPTVRATLASRGFEFVAPKSAIGGAQAISIDWDRGVLLGASDHRKDGCALGY